MHQYKSSIAKQALRLVDHPKAISRLRLAAVIGVVLTGCASLGAYAATPENHLASAVGHAMSPASRAAVSNRPDQADEAGKASKTQAAGPKDKTQSKPRKATTGKNVTEMQAVTVSGLRASLQSALDIKRNSDQMIDVVLASDIGRLPDANVAEALERVSGVQVTRSYGEGSSIAIRGLTQIKTEVNGGDVFTAGDGRVLSLGDIPSELLAGIDVYKNPSAEITAGGVGGTVNLRTHMPFDFKGQKLAVTGEMGYWDLARKSDPSASGLWSDRWDTSLGKFGVLVDLAYQKHPIRRDDVTNQPYYTVVGSPNSPASNYPGYYGRTLHIPHGGGVNLTFGKRRREGAYLAMQWWPNNKVKLYLRDLRSAYNFQWNDFSTFPITSTNAIRPDPSKPFSFAPSGLFVSGTFNGTGDGSGGFTDGIGMPSTSSLTTTYTVTNDLQLGGSWDVTNNLQLNTHLQYVKAYTNDLRYILGMQTTTPTLYENIGGAYPQFKIDNSVVSNPANNTFSYALDSIDKSYGRELAWREDADYILSGNFFRSLQVGVRTSDRKETNWNTNYSDYVYLGKPLSDLPSSVWSYRSYDMFRGREDSFQNIVVPNPKLLYDYPQSKELLGGGGALTYGPNDVNHQSQKTYAAYAMLRFGWLMGDIPVNGNVGIRAIRTQVSTRGVMNDPNGSGAFLPLNISQNYDSYLPSLNLIVHLTDDLQWRMAASKALSRPSFSNLNPTRSLSVPNTAGINAFTGTAGNPNLKPLKAKQYGMALQWYYNPSSLAYVTIFYKNVNGFIATEMRNETIDGHVYQISMPENGNDGFIKGAEAGWQTFFKFLPSPFDGLGLKLNYTYVNSKAPSPQATNTSGKQLLVPLEGLSKNSYNAILIYEKGPIQARVAYNWRSDWLVTTEGNGTGNLPVFDKAYGQMDASVTYRVGKHLNLSLLANNITDSQLKTRFGRWPGDIQMSGRVYTLRAQLNF